MPVVLFYDEFSWKYLCPTKPTLPGSAIKLINNNNNNNNNSNNNNNNNKPVV